jgi:hypothetical protein
LLAQAREQGNDPDGYLEGPERPERGSVIADSLRGDLRQVIQLGCLVHDVAGGRQRALVEESGDLEKARRDVHAPVYRVAGAEDRSGERDDPPAVLRAFSCR